MPVAGSSIRNPVAPPVIETPEPMVSWTFRLLTNGAGLPVVQDEESTRLIPVPPAVREIATLLIWAWAPTAAVPKLVAGSVSTFFSITPTSTPVTEPPLICPK